MRFISACGGKGSSFKPVSCSTHSPSLLRHTPSHEARKITPIGTPVTELLSIEFLQALTGRKTRKKMQEWLRAEGFVFRVGADGYPRVDVDHYRQRMHSSESTHPRPKPRLDALREYVSSRRSKPGHPPNDS